MQIWNEFIICSLWLSARHGLPENIMIPRELTSNKLHAGGKLRSPNITVRPAEIWRVFA